MAEREIHNTGNIQTTTDTEVSVSIGRMGKYVVTYEAKQTTEIRYESLSEASTHLYLSRNMFCLVFGSTNLLSIGSAGYGALLAIDGLQHGRSENIFQGIAMAVTGYLGYQHSRNMFATATKLDKMAQAVDREDRSNR